VPVHSGRQRHHPSHHFTRAAKTELATFGRAHYEVLSIERNQDLTNLAPKGCFISSETIERVIRQVGYPPCAARRALPKLLKLDPL
jgi:hypothetical protein